MVVAFVVLGCDAEAIRLRLSPADTRRALELARWPHTDAERTRFHQRYTTIINGPTVEYFAIQRIEVITEFRRLELIAEEHARLNDMFGRGGTRDVDEAMRPWRDRLTVLVHLTFDPSRYIVGVPTLSVVLEGATILLPLDSTITGQYSGGDQSVLVGALATVTFDATGLDQTVRPVVVRRERKEIARIPIDFGAIE